MFFFFSCESNDSQKRLLFANTHRHPQQLQHGVNAIPPTLVQELRCSWLFAVSHRNYSWVCLKKHKHVCLTQENTVWNLHRNKSKLALNVGSITRIICKYYVLYIVFLVLDLVLSWIQHIWVFLFPVLLSALASFMFVCQASAVHEFLWSAFRVDTCLGFSSLGSRSVAQSRRESLFRL